MDCRGAVKSSSTQIMRGYDRRQHSSDWRNQPRTGKVQASMASWNRNEADRAVWWTNMVSIAIYESSQGKHRLCDTPMMLLKIVIVFKFWKTALLSLNYFHKVEHGCVVATVEGARGILVVGGATGDDVVEFLDWETREKWVVLGQLNRGRGKYTQ